MSGNPFSIVKDLVIDGYKVVGFAAPLASLAFTIVKYQGVKTIPLQDLSYAWAFLPLLIWVCIAYVRRRAAHIGDQTRLHDLQSASDQSGRNSIPIREALDIVVSNLSDQWSGDLSYAEKLERSANKIRELALNDGLVITGYKRLIEPEIFRENRSYIPSAYWERAEIIVE